MSDTLRLGVLGCGVISDTYLTRAGEFEGLEVVACADIDQKRAQAQASRYSVKALDPEALIERYTPGLRRVNPAFEHAWIRERWLFQEPAAQPIVTVGYGDRIPPLATGVPGLWLANTTQIYPEDRGTNYAVRLGEQAAAAMLAG